MKESHLKTILFLAFEALLGLSDKRKITTIELDNYRKAIYQYLKEFYMDAKIFNESYEQAVANYLKVNKNMTPGDFIKELKTIISKYEDIFYMSGDTIYVKKHISLKDFSTYKYSYGSELTNGEKELFFEILQVYDIPYVLEEIGLVNAIKKVEALVLYERLLEQSYIVDNSSELKAKLYYLTGLLKNKIASMDVYKFNKYWELLDKLSEGYNEEEIDILCDEINNDPYYLKNIDIRLDLDDVYILSIFGEENLAIDNLQQFLSMVDLSKRPEYVDDDFEVDPTCDYFDDTEDSELEDYFDYEEDDIDCDTKDFDFEYECTYDEKCKEYYYKNMFYINYINTLSKYEKKYGHINDFDLVKGKLSYLIATNDYKYNDDDLSDEISPDNLSKFYVISKVFILDILLSNKIDDKSLKKILFIINYYDLTKDKRIKKLIEENRITSMGHKLYEAVINHNIDKSFKDGLTGKSKKLM